MNKTILEEIRQFEDTLRENEKAPQTIQKYVREVLFFMEFLNGEPITKENLLNYREYLQIDHKARTVNGKLSALNAYLEYTGRDDCKVKLLKVQQNVFIDEERDLSEAEYKRLLTAAKNKKNSRLYHVMLTICGTGIRVSELRFITVEAVKSRKAEIQMKGKIRTIILPKELVRKLERYAKEQGIRSGILFRTRNGKPLDRSNICHDMKKLCETARVNSQKVFPHNLRHLFAKSYYAIERNLARLADILGHSSVETTRIYVATCVREHERTIQKMRLII